MKPRVLWSFAVSLMGIVPCCAQTNPSTQPTRIAVLASFPEELQAIEKQLDVPDAQRAKLQINGVDCQTLDSGDKHYLLVVTGMSLVNAAMNTQLVLDHFAISAVTFSGIAGGVDPSLNPGDVVIPQRWHYHAEAAYFNETSPGNFNVADYFKMKHGHYGMIFPDDVTVKRQGMDRWQQQDAFEADPKLLAAAKLTADKMPPSRFGGRVCKTVVGGDGVSGTVFCDNAEYRKFVFDIFKAECLDMESTAIAHVCWQNRTPFLIVRGLSDLAGAQAGKNTVDEYLQAAADHSALALAAILNQMQMNLKEAK